MSNPVRTCIGCAKADDHPRHVIAQPDGSEVTYHLDCHVITARCEICEAQLDGVGGLDGNPKGDELRRHLVTTGPAEDQPGWTAPADQSTAPAGKKG